MKDFFVIFLLLFLIIFVVYKAVEIEDVIIEQGSYIQEVLDESKANKQDVINLSIF